QLGSILLIMCPGTTASTSIPVSHCSLRPKSVTAPGKVCGPPEIKHFNATTISTPNGSGRDPAPRPRQKKSASTYPPKNTHNKDQVTHHSVTSRDRTIIPARNAHSGSGEGRSQGGRSQGRAVGGCLSSEAADGDGEHPAQRLGRSPQQLVADGEGADV